jgi:ubiquinone biosynthesis protein Coq4
MDKFDEKVACDNACQYANKEYDRMHVIYIMVSNFSAVNIIIQVLKLSNLY